MRRRETGLVLDMAAGACFEERDGGWMMWVRRGLSLLLLFLLSVAVGSAGGRGSGDDDEAVIDVFIVLDGPEVRRR